MRSYLFLLLSLVAILSCNENRFITILDIESKGHEPQLVVSARFILHNPKQNNQFVFVTRSKALNENQYITTVDHAEVTLWEDEDLVDTGIWVDTISAFPHSLDRISGYVMKWKDFVPGKNYTLKVSAPGFTTVESTIMLPEKSEITDVKYNINGYKDPSDGNSIDEIEFKISNINAEKYYLTTIQQVSIYIRGTNRDTSYSSLYPIPESPLYQEVSGNGLVFRGEDVLPLQGLVKIALPFLNINPSSSSYYQVTLYNITKDQYYYLLSYEQYKRVLGNPFAEPVVVYSNIKNGLGIFSLEYYQAFPVK